MDPRQQRGLEIAALLKITKRPDGSWVVPSQAGKGRYTVQVGDQPTCTCPDHELRGQKCKHIYAVEYTIQRETTATENADGTTTVTETVTLTATKRTTYPQDWPAYNKAQTHEQDRFQVLLRDLCAGIPTPPREKGKPGRPSIPRADAIFAATFKVYSTFSGRRFISDLRGAHERRYIDRLPHFNSIFNCLEDPDLTPILHGLIVETSRPLASVESVFAADSSGFSTCRFVRWYDQKYGVVRNDHDWVKAHIMCGVKTNVVTAVEIHERNANDSPILPALLDTTVRHFTPTDVVADKQYSSINNVNRIDAAGAVPYIPFKERQTGKGDGKGGLWEKCFHFFNFKRDEFLAHYHKRSNAESTFGMVKAKFGDAVRSKTDVAMKNEALCKFLCHNICCLISAFYELGIEATFWPAGATDAGQVLPA